MKKMWSGRFREPLDPQFELSFTNPNPGTWIIDTSCKDGSLVSFGPKVPQVGIGLKVSYWSGSSEFPTIGKISTVTELRDAVLVKYPQTFPQSIVSISVNGFSRVEVKGLPKGFDATTNVYFVLLPTGTLNFSWPGSIGNLIHKI